MGRIFFLLFLMTCSAMSCKKEGIICTEEARAGLQLTVRSGISGVVLTEGVSVLAVSGDYVEELQRYTGDPSFVGLFERPGLYEITVTKESYRQLILDSILIDADECHVITLVKDVSIYPL
jgi:hypothetical protein